MKYIIVSHSESSLPGFRLVTYWPKQKLESGTYLGKTFRYFKNGEQWNLKQGSLGGRIWISGHQPFWLSGYADWQCKCVSGERMVSHTCRVLAFANGASRAWLPAVHVLVVLYGPLIWMTTSKGKTINKHLCCHLVVIHFFPKSNLLDLALAFFEFRTILAL